MSRIEFEAALEHHRAGRLREAETAYRDLLAREPGNADAVHGLGVVALQAGRPEEAVGLIAQAVALRPDSMAFQSNLGMAHQALRQYAQAEAAYRRAIELSPGVAGPCFNLANALKEQKRLEEAAALYRKAIELQPDYAVAYNNLGNCYRELGRLDEARQSLARAIQLRPGYAEAFLNLGITWTSSGEPVKGEVCCREALRLQPQLAQACINLGAALFAQERLPETVEAYRRAAELSPLLAEAHEHLGASLLEAGRLTDAVASFRRAAAAAPARAEAWNRLGGALIVQRQFAEGDACYQRAVELQPDDPSLLSNWLWWQLYRPEVSLRSIAARHADWNARHGGDVAAVAPQREDAAAEPGRGAGSGGAGKPAVPVRAAADRPLRLGFVSSWLGQHPVGAFSIRTLEALPPLGFEIVCYSGSPRAGAVNARFRRCAVLWREVRHMPDDALAARIAADQIDVLIDLDGHSGGNRLGTFARRPAPVQATWIGNEGTTGLTAVDYLIADEHVVPIEAEPFYTERIVRLPVSYVSWDPPSAAGAVAPPPSASTAAVTFASFNNPAKYHAALAELWSQILRRVPHSRLLLKYKHVTDPTLQPLLVELFAAHGVAAERLVFHDWQPYSELLDSYRDVDVALDPFPFGGGATTCEALWMGVPVVTWPGATFSSRHSCSYLSTVGLRELIAESGETYVEIAVQLARDLPHLRSLRESLRGKVEASPLCDGRCCAQGLAAVLRRMWSGDADATG